MWMIRRRRPNLKPRNREAGWWVSWFSARAPRAFSPACPRRAKTCPFPIRMCSADARSVNQLAHHPAQS